MSAVDFTSFLKLMVHKKASDLFITAGIPPSIKVHGRVAPITQNPLTPQMSRDMVLNVMTPSQREEFEKTHECQFAIGVSGVGRFRVSCFYQRNNVGMVLRRIETRIPTIEELNLPPVVKTLAMTKRGIIIFVGATGTGKSTSLAAMLGYRNQNSTGHIITIEDPIEYVHKHEKADLLARKSCECSQTRASQAVLGLGVERVQAARMSANSVSPPFDGTERACRSEYFAGMT